MTLSYLICCMKMEVDSVAASPPIVEGAEAWPRLVRAGGLSVVDWGEAEGYWVVAGRRWIVGGVGGIDGEVDRLGWWQSYAGAVGTAVVLGEHAEGQLTYLVAEKLKHEKNSQP